MTSFKKDVIFFSKLIHMLSNIFSVTLINNFQAKDCPMNLGRIDWILFKNKGESFRDATPNVLGGVRARIKLIAQAQIIRDAEPPLYPSDHYPVLADFHLIIQ